MRWPRTLSGQLLALWVVAILVAHLAAVLILSWWRIDHVSVHPLSARAIEARILSAYQAFAGADDAASLARRLTTREASFAVLDSPPPEAVDHRWQAQESALAHALDQRLHLTPPAAARVQIIAPPAGNAGPPDRRNWLEKALGSPLALVVDAAVPLPDGRWLRSRSWPSLLPAHWERVLSFSLLVGTTPAALIALLFGRQIMLPLARLTEAARRVSRGERVTLPPPRGPGGVREITQAFNDMQDSLVRFVNGRTQMLAAVGHDLRTPLTSLRIRAELVDDPALRNAMVATIDEMSAMVEETLRFAQDDAHLEATQDVDLDTLVQSVVDEQCAKGHAVRRTHRLGPGQLYRCRPVHFKRALNNLIDNAARYGEVRVGLTQHDATRTLRIEVEDDGPGIPPDQLEQVFEPFVRLDSARGAGGTGLGLAITRSCVRAHGGDVNLYNRPEGGLCARIELPL